MSKEGTVPLKWRVDEQGGNSSTEMRNLSLENLQETVPCSWAVGLSCVLPALQRSHKTVIKTLENLHTVLIEILCGEFQE